MFSKACEYAIKAMIFIEAYGAEKNLNLNEISEAVNSPVAFTSKILQQLRKHGLLESTKGIKGGFHINNNKEISLKDIVIAIDGDGIFNHCVLGLSSCSSANPCPAHVAYIKIKEEIMKTMLNSTLSNFSESIKNKSIKLK